MNSNGAHQPDRQELDADAIAGATVVVDTLVQARAEKGECAGGGGGTDLLVGHPCRAGRRRLRTCGRSGAGRTVFASSGSGLESLAALAGVLACLQGDDSLPRVDLDGTTG